MDKVMEKVKGIFEGSVMSLQELGEKMGYKKELARKSAHQFMQGGDPRISSLRRFCAATGVRLGTLVMIGELDTKLKQEIASVDVMPRPPKTVDDLLEKPKPKKSK